MLLMDYHLHSRYSGDGESTPEEICIAAREKGIAHIAVTDHYDIGNEKYEITDLDAYAAELRQVRSMHPNIDVALGMEMDYRPETWAKTREVPGRLGLDFALLSLHFVDGVDPYLPEFFEARTQRQGYEYYLERMAEMIATTNGPWVLAHITYVSKFARFDDPQLRYADYADHMDEVLRRAAGKGYGLEVNASGIKNRAGLLPGVDTLRRFRELGGEIVTVGSDAHEARNAGRWIEEAQQAVREAGFRYLAVFKDLKPQFIQLD